MASCPASLSAFASRCDNGVSTASRSDERQRPLGNRSRCEPQRFPNILWFKVWIFFDDFRGGHSRSYHANNGGNRKPEAPNTRHSAHFVWFDCDSRERHGVP